MADFRVFLCVVLCFNVVLCQFGFYPREQRRHGLPFGQNLFNPRRITNRLTGILHTQPENYNTNPAFIYPFNNRPVVNQGYYDQYGRPVNQNQYPPDNQNYDNRNPVRFPNSNFQNSDYNNQYNGQDNYENYGQNGPFNNFDGQGNPSGYDIPNGQNQVFNEQNQGFNEQNQGFIDQTYNPEQNSPIEDNKETNTNYNDFNTGSNNEGNEANPGFSFVMPDEAPQNKPLEPLTPQGTSKPDFGFQTEKPKEEIPNPGFSEVKPNETPQEKPLEPLAPIGTTPSNYGFQTEKTKDETEANKESQNENPGFSVVKPDEKPLQPLAPAGTSPPNYGFQTEKPQEGFKEANENGNSGFAIVMPDALPQEKPLAPLTPAGTSPPNFGFADEKPSGLNYGVQNEPAFGDRNGDAGFQVTPPTGLVQGSVTTLAPLTPVPDQEKRNNFNFGTQGIFKEVCQTVDGGSGSCVSVLNCREYLDLLQSSSSNPAAVQTLRKAHCGFEGNYPKVCCPAQGIPTAPPATTTTTTTQAPLPQPSGKTVLGDYVTAFPEPPVCGFSNASFSRVVGGVDAKLGDFPWMALLGYKGKRSPNTRWLCGGSLITSRHVLTAAHCIHGHEDDLYVVRVGELDLASEDEGATPVDVLIKTKVKHEEYNPKAFTNDIGVLLLEKDVPITDLIKPICVPKAVELRSNTFENYNPIIAGWGDTEFRGPSATHLQALQLPVVSNDFCAKAYSAYKAQTIDDRVLCAGYKKGGKDACQGDSGGPLMQPIWNQNTGTTYFYQIGVVSFGKRCAEAGFPGVYSRVTHFVPWLEKVVLGA